MLGICRVDSKYGKSLQLTKRRQLCQAFEILQNVFLEGRENMCVWRRQSEAQSVRQSRHDSSHGYNIRGSTAAAYMYI